jgi:hypothetical protein
MLYCIDFTSILYNGVCCRRAGSSRLLSLALDGLTLQLLAGIPCLVGNLLAGSTNGSVLLECGTDGTTLLGGEGTTDCRGVSMRYKGQWGRKGRLTLLTDLADLTVCSELGSDGTTIGAERLCDLLDGLSDLFSDGYTRRKG